MTSLWRWTKEKTRAAGYILSGRSDAEKLVFEATNDDPWGPANSQMQEIARLTNNYNDYEDIKKAIWEQMGDVDEIRHVQKSLLLLEYLLRCGSDSLRSDTRMMLGQLQNLTHLQRFETGEEAALEAVIRKKAADIIQMVNDTEIYKMEREKARKVMGAVSAVSGNTESNFGMGGFGNDSFNERFDPPKLPSTKVTPSVSPYEKTSSESDAELDFDPRQKPSTSQPSVQRQPRVVENNNTFDPFGQSNNPQPKPKQSNVFDPFAPSNPPPSKPQVQQNPDLLLFGNPSPQPTIQNKPQQNNTIDDLFDFSSPPKPTPKPQINPNQFNQPVNQPNIQPKQQPKPQNNNNFGFDDFSNFDLKAGQKGYGKAQQTRGNGPTLGGF